MLDLGPHASFIWAAYAVTVAVVAVLIVWAFAGEARQRRNLEELDSRGIVRRSARGRNQSASRGAEEE